MATQAATEFELPRHSLLEQHQVSEVEPLVQATRQATELVLPQYSPLELHQVPEVEPFVLALLAAKELHSNLKDYLVAVAEQF